LQSKNEKSTNGFQKLLFISKCQFFSDNELGLDFVNHEPIELKNSAQKFIIKKKIPRLEYKLNKFDQFSKLIRFCGKTGNKTNLLALNIPSNLV
jgi:hypothetical protein